MQGCGGWTTLASSDSVGHAYLFDILRSEMRFFSPRPNFQPLSLLPLVYEVGYELWQLAARKNTATEKKIPHVRREKEVFTDRLKLGLGPTAIVLFRRSNDDPQDN